MALKIPFTRDTFSIEGKEIISGVNRTIEFDNVKSSLIKEGREVAKIIGQTFYDKICEKKSSEDIELQSTAYDFLQRAVYHFAMCHHTIFLISRIGNDGITVKKNDDEATIFKYQQIQLENVLISDGWFWMNELINFLNLNADKFPDWHDSDEKKDLDNLPVDKNDFNKWVGVNSEYFMLIARWIIREVWNECVRSRYKEPQKTEDIARAVCYEVMARSCIRLAYFTLPEPIRLDISSELGKNHAAQEDKWIRERVSTQFAIKAEGYWRALDSDIAHTQSINQSEYISPNTYHPRGVSESDKFMY